MYSSHAGSRIAQPSCLKYVPWLKQVSLVHWWIIFATSSLSFFPKVNKQLILFYTSASWSFTVQSQKGWQGMKMGTCSQWSPQLAVGWPIASGGMQLMLNATEIRKGFSGLGKVRCGKLEVVGQRVGIVCKGDPPSQRSLWLGQHTDLGRKTDPGV